MTEASAQRAAGARVDHALDGAQRWSIRLAAFFAPLSIAGVEIAVVVSALAWGGRRLRGNGPGWPRTAMDVPFLAFLAAGVLSAVVGMEPLRSLVGLHSYLWVAFLYVVLANARDDRERRVIVRFLLAAMAIAAYHRLANYIYNDPLPRKIPHPYFFPEWGPGRMTRANQLVLGIPLAHALWLGARTRGAKLGYGILLGLLGAGLVGTLKRAAAAAVVAAVSIQWWLRRRWMVAVVVLGAVVFAATYTPLRDRIGELPHDLRNPDNRVWMWRIGWDLVKEHPLGIGVDNADIMQRWDMTEFGFDAAVSAPKHKHFHSNPIHIAVETGIQGLVTWGWWAAVMIMLLAARLRAVREAPDPFARALVLGTLTGVVGWHLAGLLEFTFGDSEVMLVLFLLVGLALGAGQDDAATAPASSASDIRDPTSDVGQQQSDI